MEKHNEDYNNNYKNSKEELKSYYQVVQSNSLVLAEHKMNLQELLAFKLIICMLDTKNKNCTQITIKKSEVIKALYPELKTKEAENIPGEYYKLCKKYLRNLLEKKVVINEKKSVLYTTLCAAVRWEKYEDITKISFSEEILPYIMNLEEYFTTYCFSVLRFLNSKYSVRLYEHCKMHMYGLSYTWIELLETFRKYFGLQNKYNNVSNLIKWVLKPAIEDINSYRINEDGIKVKKTDIEVSYKLIKGGYRNSEIIAIKFNAKDLTKKAREFDNKRNNKMSIPTLINETKKLSKISKEKNNVQNIQPGDSYITNSIKQKQHPVKQSEEEIHTIHTKIKKEDQKTMCTTCNKPIQENKTKGNTKKSIFTKIKKYFKNKKEKREESNND